MANARVLVDLEDNINSRKWQLRLNQEEQKVLLNYRATANNRFGVGLITGASLVWAASSKLHTLLRINLSVPAKLYTFFRINLSLVAGLQLGRWSFRRSIESSVEHMLSLNGTQLQRELAIRIVRNYQNDPSMIRLISKHFYLEEVYDDSSSEPRLRLRYRNFFGDQGMSDDSQNDSHNASPNDFHDNFDSKKTDLRPKQIPVNSGIDLMGDPLDCVFGYTATAGEIHHASTSSVPTRAQSRAHERAHRRRQLRHQKDSLGSRDQ